MMFKKKLMVSAMATAFVVGAALSGSAQAIRISETGAGQVLLGGIYSVQNGISSTNITVVNNSRVDAVKARIALRSMLNSEECRDLVLYLSPGDVWRGVVNSNAAGQAQLTSSDDSVLSALNSGAPVFATPAVPYSNALAQKSLSDPNDTCNVGHIEVVGAYAVRGKILVDKTNPNQSGKSVNVFQGMSKMELYNIFSLSRGDLNLANNDAKTPNTFGEITSVDPTRVQLSGNVEVNFGNDRALYPFVALRDGVNPGTDGTSTKVIGNAGYDFTQAFPADLGRSMGYGGTDNVTDIEYALASQTYNSSYEQDGTKKSNVIFTYPTKYRHANNGATANITLDPADPAAAGKSGKLGCPASTAGQGYKWSAPFDKKNGAIQYGFASWDNSELGVTPFESPVGIRSFMNNEVEYIDTIGLATKLGVPSMFFANSGWFSLNPVQSLTDTGMGCSYLGLPATGYVHRFNGTTGASTASVLETMVREYK